MGAVDLTRRVDSSVTRTRRNGLVVPHVGCQVCDRQTCLGRSEGDADSVLALGRRQLLIGDRRNNDPYIPPIF